VLGKQNSAAPERGVRIISLLFRRGQRKQKPSAHSMRSIEILIAASLLALASAFAQEISLKGRVLDPQGNALPNATLQLAQRDHVLATATSGPDGQFNLKTSALGDFVLKAAAPGFRSVTRIITIHASANAAIEINLIQLSSRLENITVIADARASDVLNPDPAERIFVSEDLLDANP